MDYIISIDTDNNNIIAIDQGKRIVYDRRVIDNTDLFAASIIIKDLFFKYRAQEIICCIFESGAKLIDCLTRTQDVNHPTFGVADGLIMKIQQILFSIQQIEVMQE